MNKKNVEDIYPLSPTQQGILFQTLAEPGSGIHVEQLVCELQGRLDLEAFRRAWQSVLDRHAILRTGFLWKNLTDPVQVVLRRVELPLEWHDWQALEPQARADGLQAYLAGDRQRGFDLSHPPLMRLALFQTAPQRHHFVWSHNHILMDGWCGPVLIGEFLILYQAFRAGTAIDLPSGRAYKDYIRWLKGRDLAQAETFWKERLAGLSAPTPLGMPAEPLPADQQVERYGEAMGALDESLTASLRALAQSRHLTLNTLVQGAWALLLWGYSDRQDVLFSTTVSGRPPELPGIEATIGLFINTLPVRAQIDPQAPLLDWLEKLQSHNIELQQYEFTPGPLIHRWSGLPGMQPLAESLVVFENYPISVPEYGATGLRVDLGTVEYEGARTGFALTLLAIDGPALRFRLVHDLRRLGVVDSANILQHLIALFSAIGAHPERRLREILPDQVSTERPRFHALPARQNLAQAYVPPRTVTEARLATLWAELLGAERIGIYDNFFELGGHSLLAVELYYRVREIFPVQLSLLSLFEEPNVARLAQVVEAGLRGELEPGLDLVAELQALSEVEATNVGATDVGAWQDTNPASKAHPLATPLQGQPTASPLHGTPRASPPAASPPSILLTGATGFLGAYLLRELLEQTRARVACLVRAADEDEALRRIQRHLQKHGLWQDDYAPRLVLLPGDLARPLLGLGEARFKELAESLDLIYHNGAWVTYLFPYSVLKPANVLGTQEVLRLASQGRSKALHYISSLGIFPLSRQDGAAVYPEDASLGDGSGLVNGYAQSKWVAEGLVWAAHQRGLPVAVYRPGMVTGHSRSGAAEPGDMLALMLKGCLQAGCFPILDTLIDMTPVDYVSRAVVTLSQRPESLGRAFHLVNPAPAHWMNIWEWVRACGFPLEARPYAEWLARLASSKESQGISGEDRGAPAHLGHNALIPVIPMLGERQPDGEYRFAKTRQPEYRSDQSVKALGGSGVSCPPVDADLVRTYVEYFASVGFLPQELEKTARPR